MQAFPFFLVAPCRLHPETLVYQYWKYLFTFILFFLAQDYYLNGLSV